MAESGAPAAAAMMRLQLSTSDGSAPACLMRSRSATAAACTAGPVLDTVIDPAEIGLSGRFESPSSNRTRSIGTPSASAAICVITVYVPVPNSCVAASTRMAPSAVSVAAADAGIRLAGYVAVAMPRPIR